jgi:hypothetical protein
MQARYEEHFKIINTRQYYFSYVGYCKNECKQIQYNSGNTETYITWHDIIHINHCWFTCTFQIQPASSSNQIHRQQTYISTTWITTKSILEIRVFTACYCFTQSTVTSQVHLAIYATNVTVVPSSAKYMHYPNNSKHWKRRKIVNTSASSFSDRLPFQCAICCTNHHSFLATKCR